MPTLSPDMLIVAVVGCAAILWTIALTARKYPTLPAVVAYSKNYGDGGEMSVPKLIVWFVPALQIVLGGLAAWGLSSAEPNAHRDPATGLVVIDIVLLVLFFVQRGVMLQPDST